MIKGFFKLVFGLMRLAFFLLLFLVIFHAWVIKQVFTFSLSHQLGADVFVQSVKMDWKNTGVEIQGLEIGNPYDFPKGTLANLPLVILSVDLPSLRQGELRFKAVGIDLRELQVMNIARKGLNLLALKPLEAGAEERSGSNWESAPSSGKRFAFRVVIDELILSVGEISYLDGSGPSLKEAHYNAGIRGATYYDIEGTRDVVAIVAQETLKKLGMGYLKTKFQKLQDRYLPGAAKKNGLFNKIVSALNGDVGG